MNPLCCRRGLAIVALAAAATLLNAWKPPVVDDSAYITYARAFAQHPSHPYDFEYYGMAANTYMVPPVLPTWLALGIPLVGDDAFALKLWLFPIMLLFAASMYDLLRHFAPGKEMPFLILTIFSPAILPSINIMLDVPVQAIGLAALAVYFRAACPVERGPCDRSSNPSIWLALLAGVLAGLAMETKYTAFTLPAVFLAHAWLHSRWRSALVASITAVGFFAGCEAWIAMADGNSHFVLALHDPTHHNGNPFRLVNAVVTQFGGVCGALWLIGLTVLGVWRGLVYALLGWIAIGFGLLILVPERASVLLQNSAGSRPLLTINHFVFVPIGAFFLITVIGLARRLWWTASPNDPESRLDRFLVLWVIIEVAGYLTISPFPAMRRVLSLLIAITFVIARWASLSRLSREQDLRIEWLTAAGVLLGLTFYAIERRDGLLEQQTLNEALAFIREEDPKARIRFCADWGVRYRAEKEGILWSKNLGGDVEPGEWFIYEDRCCPQIAPEVAARLVLVRRVGVAAEMPVSTQKTFYLKNSPLIHCEQPIVELLVYRRQP